MKRKVLLVVMAAVLGLSTISFAAAGEKLDLKLQFKAGEKRQMKMTQVQNIVQTMQGQERKMKQTMEMAMSIEILAVDANGVADAKVAYESMKMKMESPQGGMEFDSSDPDSVDPNNPMEKMLADTIGTMFTGTITMKIDPQGKTSDIKGLDEMMNKAIEKGGPGVEVMKQMFSEKKLDDMMKDMFGVFPDRPVAVGDTWNSKINLDMGFPMDVDTTYTLKKREHGLAFIDSAATMDMGDGASTIEAGPMGISFQMAGKISQSATVDEVSGWMQKSNGAVALAGVVKMEANEQMPQGMTIPMQIEGTFTMEITKVK